MLSHKRVLRQRYFLGFFATTLVIGLTTQPSLAFSVNPLRPVGVTQNWDNDESMTPKSTTVHSPIQDGTVSFCGRSCI